MACSDVLNIEKLSPDFWALKTKLAERSVRTVKQLLEDSPDPYQALLSYRTTPSHPVLSPAELLMGRKI